MGQTLTNGVYLPDEGERNCYAGLAANWRIVDGHVGDMDIHVTYEDKFAWNNHIDDTVKHVTAEDKNKWNAVTSKADASALTAHTGDTTIHVTAADKAKWDAVTGKANDADAVHKSGAETIAGLKTFTDLMSIDGDYLGNEASTNQRTNLQLRSNRDTEGKSGTLITRFRQNRTQGGLLAADFQMLGFDFLENEVRTSNILSIQATGWADSVPTKVYIVSSTGDYSYGNSARPCKINDNNPGALSLPDISAGVDISGYITAGNTHNEYTPTVDGWISVILKKTTTSGALAIFLYQGDVCNSYFGNTALPNDTEFCGMASIPVKAGSVVNIDLKGSNTYVYSAKFYPCRGNV